MVEYHVAGKETLVEPFRGGCPGHLNTDVSLSILASPCGRRPFVIINPFSYKHFLERYIH